MRQCGMAAALPENLMKRTSACSLDIGLQKNCAGPLFAHCVSRY